MSLVDKVFEIVEDDEELRIQFPEMEPGVVFKVVTMDDDGITSVKIKNGPYLHVNSRDTWFWCFYCSDTMHQIKEIEEQASDVFPEVPVNMFKGVSIVSALYKCAGQENCDSEEYDLMQAAGDYIRYLEKQLEFSDRAF